MHRVHADRRGGHHHRHHRVGEGGRRHRDDVGGLGEDAAQRPFGTFGGLLSHAGVPIAHEQQRGEEVNGGESEERSGEWRIVHPVAPVAAELRAGERGHQADQQQQGDRLADPGRRDIFGRREAVLVHEGLIRAERGAGDAQTGEAAGHDRKRRRDRREPPDRAGQHKAGAAPDTAHDGGGGVRAQPETHDVQRHGQGREGRVRREQEPRKAADEHDQGHRRSVQHGGDREDREVGPRRAAFGRRGWARNRLFDGQSRRQPFGIAAIIWISMSSSGAARSAVTVKRGGGRCSSKNSR